MAIIEGFRVKNYGSLKNVALGKLWNTWKRKPLTPLTAVIGKNGAGKSTLFDAFGFLADCLKIGVEEACDANGRGGFKRIRSQHVHDPIEIEVYYRQTGKSRPITYHIAIDLDKSGRPYVKSERLRQRRQGQKSGRPFSFLILNEGKGWVWSGSAVGIQEEDESGTILNIVESPETENIQLTNTRELGITTLGQLKQHNRISKFIQFIEGWYLSYFTPDSARSLPLVGPQKHLSVHGDNLGNVVQFMEREHKSRFQRVLNKIAQRIPGIDKISTEMSPDGRLLLRFNDKGFTDPFYAQQMSDGTLKVFTYLLLLEDPTPPPFICIEEPENGLYHKLLEILANEFREHATGPKGGAGGSQIFITTHQPYLVDALSPEEVWILEKAEDGYSKIKRAADDSVVKSMVEEGLPLGSLWYSDYLDER